MSNEIGQWLSAPLVPHSAGKIENHHPSPDRARLKGEDLKGACLSEPDGALAPRRLESVIPFMTSEGESDERVDKLGVGDTARAP